MNPGKASNDMTRELKLTQSELCERIQISQTSLSQIELGKKEPSKRTLEKISKALDIPVGLIYILAIEDQDVPSSKSALYSVLFPSIKQLTLNIVKNES